MRPAFAEIVSGWALVTGLQAITERIEAAAKWAEANGPLEPDEAAMARMMIDCQIARGMDEEW